MPFRLRRDTREWFREIQNSFQVDFDMYYLCLMAGLAAGGRRAEVLAQDTTELVDNFPGPYREKSRIIISALLASEIGRLGVSLEDKTALHSVVNSLVDPRTPSQLSDEGLRLMNSVSYGGFDVLTEKFDDRPRTLETFLIEYHQITKE